MTNKSEKELVRTWLEAAIAGTGKSVASIAKQASVAPSTLYRTLNPNSKEILTGKNIMRVAAVTGMQPPKSNNSLEDDGFSEPEALPYTPGKTPQIDPQDLTKAEWVMNSRALEAAGILEGDILTFDLNLQPTFGDIVVAQLYSLQRSEAETVIRRYEPPYLTTATFDLKQAYTPALVDNKQALIRGTMVQLKRIRT